MSKFNKKRSGFPVASLVLGIISIPASFFWYVALPTGVLAIVFGVKSIKESDSKLGKAGMILGIIGLSFFIFLYVTMIILLVLQDVI